jgi:YegS/Rv2252/BmrU family lipid kinase
LAAEAARDGADLVVAAGGDGTANETATGLLGTDVPLAIVPVGSGNGLARALRVPLRPTRALAALSAGRDATMDVGLSNERPFLNIAGAGVDAEVGDLYHRRGHMGGRRGIAPYVWLAARTLPFYPGREVRLEADDTPIESRVVVVAALNGRQYGAGAQLVPTARLDDGWLDLIVVERGPLLRMVWAAGLMFLGRLGSSSLYTHRRARRIVLAAAGVSHRDGEPEPAADRLEWRVRPAALRVRVPAATLDDPDGPFGAQASAARS